MIDDKSDTCKIPAPIVELKEWRRDVPLMLWDGDCGFCAKWIKRWKGKTSNKIQYFPYQSFDADSGGRLKEYPRVNVQDCRQAVQFVMPDGAHYKAAEAVFRALDYAGTNSAWLWMYQHIPGFKFLSEFGYQFTARHRSGFSRFIN